MTNSVALTEKPFPLLTCSRCQQLKPTTEFARNKANPRGYQPQCKSCRALQRATRREAKQEYGRDYYQKNKERMNQQHLEYMRKHRQQKRTYSFIERARKKDPNAYPLATFCELCPDNDKRAAEEMHHFDYEYPHIYASLCSSCHKWNHCNPVEGGES